MFTINKGMKKEIFLLGLMLVSLAMQSQPPLKTDKNFVMRSSEAGMMEVKLGELASSRGKSESVKRLGEHIAIDHTKTNNELTILATKKNIPLASKLSRKNQKRYDKLSKLSGEKFDRCYTKKMIKDHRKIIALFKTESAKGDDADLKKWSGNTLPALQHHLDMSKDACDGLKNK